MSEVVGRLAIQARSHYLEKAQGGSGILQSGVPGVRPGEAVILGGGVVGTNSATVALGIGPHVTIVTRNIDRLRYLSEVLQGNLETVVSTPENIANEVKEADLVVGAVLVPGGGSAQNRNSPDDWRHETRLRHRGRCNGLGRLHRDYPPNIPQ